MYMRTYHISVQKNSEYFQDNYPVEKATRHSREESVYILGHMHENISG